MTQGRAPSLGLVCVWLQPQAGCTWSITLTLLTETWSHPDLWSGIFCVDEDPEASFLMGRIWEQKKALEKQAPDFIWDNVNDQKLYIKAPSKMATIRRGFKIPLWKNFLVSLWTLYRGGEMQMTPVSFGTIFSTGAAKWCFRVCLWVNCGKFAVGHAGLLHGPWGQILKNVWWQ